MVKLKTLLLSALFITLLPAVLPAKADNLSVRMPGFSLSIGDRDHHGNYWDGGRWRDRGWWERHHRPYRHHGPRFYGPPHGHAYGHDRRRGYERGFERGYERGYERGGRDRHHDRGRHWH
ncbi:DUF2502 domain-containing protein [Chimaeribacter arupi]|uniref:DUF2502 domain-containing protein n=1 Tax=Chimaeribacter arupi TaxID=2060066 RepID=UPI000C7DC192|nr:DUF2502 domain-containing protein [Chimaeribacter arupi]PLR38863.1 hypothetical protein CYR23_02085 [Chimaeribacter arupi]